MFAFVRPVAITTTTLASSNVSETVAAYSAGTTYAKDAVVYRVVAGIHRKFISQAAGNTGNTPETDDGTWWLDAGPTNAWALFDDTASTVTENADTINVEVALPTTERADTLYLQQLTGLSARVQVTGPDVAYDQTFGLRETAGITDEYLWSFEPIVEKTELLVTDLPRDAGLTVEVTIDNTGGTARCGNVVLGFRKTLGLAQWGWRTEIRDYSVFTDSAFGARVLVERPYRKLASGTFLIENRAKDGVETLLAGARAKVRLYLVDDGYASLAVFGTCRWGVDMNLPPDFSQCSAQLESNV